MRTVRSQSFCFQEKRHLNLLREKYDGAELVKYHNLYLTLTEIESDLPDGNNLSDHTIALYSGLNVA